MFWLAILATAVTYPIVFAGSCLILLIMVILSSGSGGMSDVESPFVSPAGSYRWYRKTFDGWVSDISEWYKKESK